MPALITLALNPALDLATTTDHVTPTHKLRCGPVQRFAGGGGINVARVLHRLGADVGGQLREEADEPLVALERDGRAMERLERSDVEGVAEPLAGAIAARVSRPVEQVCQQLSELSTALEDLAER